MKIIVDSEEEKQKLIKQSEYIHDFVVRCYLKRRGAKRFICLDSNKAGGLMHLYMAPEIIVVEPKK